MNCESLTIQIACTFAQQTYLKPLHEFHQWNNKLDEHMAPSIQSPLISPPPPWAFDILFLEGGKFPPWGSWYVQNSPSMGSWEKRKCPTHGIASKRSFGRVTKKPGFRFKKVPIYNPLYLAKLSNDPLPGSPLRATCQMFGVKGGGWAGLENINLIRHI